MNEQEIIALCNQTLAREFELELDMLKPTARFSEDLGLDSLDAVDMVMAMEEAFDYKLRDNNSLSQIRTVRDLHQYIISILDNSQNAGR